MDAALVSDAQVISPTYQEFMAMTRKATFQRANVLNAVSLLANAAMAVVATTEAERPGAVTASFKCGDCSMIFASNANTSPFCVSCGSDHVEAEAMKDGLPPEQLPADAELSAFECASCSTFNVLASSHVKDLKSHAHCVTCGTVHNLDVTAEADDEEDAPADEDKAKDQQDQQDEQDEQDASAKKTTAKSAKPGDKAVTKPKKPVTAGSPEDNFGGKKAAPFGKDGKAEDQQDASEDVDQDQETEQDSATGEDGIAAVPVEPTESTEPVAPVTAGDQDDPMAVETVPLEDSEILQDQSGQDQQYQQDSGDQQQNPQQYDQQMAGDPGETNDLPDPAEPLIEDLTAKAAMSVTVSLVSAALAKNPKAELELTHTGTHILAMVDGQHVATLAESAKAEFAGLFDKAPFAQSIIHLSRNEGVMAALDKFGFTKNTVKVPLAPVIAALVKRGVGKETKALSATTKSLSNDLTQSLSIAASALNKGLFKSRSNPLKEAMVQALSSLGVANPTRVVSNVFKSSGDAYVKALLECALELKGKSLEFRNELSASLQDMQALDTPEFQSADDDEDEGDHEFRASTNFEVPARAVTAKVHPQNVTSIQAIRANVAGPLFKRH